MPLLKTQMSSKESGWGLWFITEAEQELSEASKETVDPSIVSNTKRLVACRTFFN